MVAHAKAAESKQDPWTFVDRRDQEEATRFRGSFSGYERNAWFVSPGVGAPFVEAGFGAGLDLDEDGRAVAPIDMDGDGDLDLAVLSLQSLRLLQNPTPKRHFARVRLRAARKSVDSHSAPDAASLASATGSTVPPTAARATHGHANALGAWVRVEAGGRKQLAEVRLTAGFHTQISPELHFGLGDAEQVEAIEVRWPGGVTQRFTDLPADARLVLTEGRADAQVEALRAWPAEAMPRALGTLSLDARVDTLDGASVPIGVRGRPTVVNFWAPWCEACAREMPALVRLRAELGDAVDFVGVSVEREKRESVQAFAGEHHIDYPVRLATDEAITAFFGPDARFSLPVTFVFDARGQVRRAFHREVDAAEVAATLRTATSGIAPTDYLALAERSLATHDEGQARALVAGAVANAGDDIDITVRAAELYLRLRDAGAAEAALRPALARRPDSADAWAIFAGTLGQQGHLEEAETAIGKALALAPKNPRALNADGMAHMARGDFAGAAARFEAALKHDPEFDLARANLDAARQRLDEPP
ncbi:MAG: ASPIC/UnbV domain-containing protein [Myxococcales bacterium]|nr:ASPIC/UnbV domain-containing protein [Myxococcales bacterium]